MFSRLRWLAILLGAHTAASAQGGVIEFTDKDDWLAAVGAFTTLTFTEFPDETLITDQYEELGVLFTDGNDTITCCDDIQYPNDGSGLYGNGTIRLTFSAPQAYIGIDYWSTAGFHLYSEGELVYSTTAYFSGGPGSFAGLLSSDFFDEALLTFNPALASVRMDDLHFGVPAPSTLGMFGLYALRPRRRRCRPAS
ncbi:MAG: hypothetical protein ACYS15_13635 [Planctomycetota bacterium]|jgi:hypothetical protein